MADAANTAQLIEHSRNCDQSWHPESKHQSDTSHAHCLEAQADKSEPKIKLTRIVWLFFYGSCLGYLNALLVRRCLN